MVGEGSELSVWRLEHIVGGRPEPARGASATAIVEDEEVPVAVVATSQTLEGWDLGTGDRLWQNPGSGALDLAPVPGRGAVVAGRWDGAVELVNARSGASVIFGDRPHGERPAGKLEAEHRGDVLDLGDGLILEAQASAAAPEDGRLFGGSGLSAIHCSSWTTRRRTTSRYHGKRTLRRPSAPLRSRRMDTWRRR